MNSKFILGQLIATDGVADLIAESEDFACFVGKCLARYMSCDWGDLCSEDDAANNEAVINGEDHIFSAYVNPDRDDWKIWIITEEDRSATTILFPGEY